MPPLETDRSFAFVCGCGHSGTTLTAAKLGNHSQVLLLGRETNAFDPQNGALGAKKIVSEWSYFASVEGKRLVLEKTPKHVHSINTIKRIIPTAKILLTVRNPLDNIASLYRRFGNLNLCVARWLADNKAVVRKYRQGDVLLIRYEELTRAPVEEFKKMTDFLGLPWEAAIVGSGSTQYSSVDQVGNMKLRSEQVQAAIEPRDGVWRETFTESEAKSVVDRTARLAEQLGYEGV